MSRPSRKGTVRVSDGVYRFGGWTLTRHERTRGWRVAGLKGHGWWTPWYGVHDDGRETCAQPSLGAAAWATTQEACIHVPVPK